MKIGIDAQTTLGEKTGFGFYVENLTKALQRVSGADTFELFYPDQESDLSTMQRFWWDQVMLPKIASKSRVDLLHQPAFSAPILYTGKKVVTIHDVISLFYPNIPFVSRQFYSKWMPISYHFADHFITVSEYSKRDIVQKLHISADSITVINLAAGEEYTRTINAEYSARVRHKYHLKRPYILHVGTINPRKNLEFLVRVYAVVKRDHHIEHQLVITGKKGWHYDALFRLVADLGLENDVVFTGYVQDDEKPALYHGADLFVFPSVYEGFGLPPLEAMSCGVPVICSNTSSLPEVIGDGGISISPTDEAGWAEAIMAVLGSPARAKELAGKGRRQAARFSWDRCAKETLSVYHAVCQSKENK